MPWRGLARRKGLFTLLCRRMQLSWFESRSDPKSTARALGLRGHDAAQIPVFYTALRKYLLAGLLFVFGAGLAKP